MEHEDAEARHAQARSHARDLARKLAETEKMAAATFDELAETGRDEDADHRRALAAEARKAAERATEIADS